MENDLFTIHVSLTKSCQNKRRRRARVLSSSSQWFGFTSVGGLGQGFATLVGSTHVVQSVSDSE